MASGLAHPQWNGADVTAPDPDLEGARAFYAGRGVRWAVRVPSGMPWAHGRHLFRMPLMGLVPAALRPAAPVCGLELRPATAGDLEAVLAVDAAAFGVPAALQRPWLAPHLGAPGVTVALASLAGEPVGTAYTLRTDGTAGPSAFLAGVAVSAAARRRGVGAAMSAWLLERAFAEGAELAHLAADTDAAARVYARLGFTPAGGLEVHVDP